MCSPCKAPEPSKGKEEWQQQELVLALPAQDSLALKEISWQI